MLTTPVTAQKIAPDTGTVRLPQLDGIRGTMCLIVLLVHMNVLPLFNDTSIVISFFVLSGFLITRILLKLRMKHAAGLGSWRRLLGDFYVRRFLRILPVAYCVLLVTSALIEDVRRALAWHLTYLSNIFFSFYELSDMNWTVWHFWTLAVEEQFYLLWPPIILLVPLRRLRDVLVCLLLIGPVSRLGITFFLPERAAYYLLPGNFDGFALGGWLAVSEVDARLERLRRIFSKMGAFVGVPVYAVCLWPAVRTAMPISVRAVVEPMAIAFWSYWLVERGIRNAGGWVGWTMSLPIFVWIGRRSYSLYAWHPLVLLAATSVLELNEGTLQSALICLALVFCSTVISFQLLERGADLAWDAYSRRASARRAES